MAIEDPPGGMHAPRLVRQDDVWARRKDASRVGRRLAVKIQGRNRAPPNHG
jgi:hypothetical protein